MAGDSKTEKATQKKRRDERKKGNIFQSKDAVTLVSIVGMFYGLKFFSPVIYTTMKKNILLYLDLAGSVNEINNGYSLEIGQRVISDFVIMALPMLILSCFITIVATVAQTRFLFAPEGFKPKFSRLNPLQGIKRIVSLRSLIEVLKGIIKITILVVIIYNFIRDIIVTIPKLIDMELGQSSIYTLNMVMDMIIKIAIAFTAIAIFDYFYQWWDHERQLRMSKEEIKEEYKQLEGDPKIKSKIKENQRKMAMSRMMQSVPSADVVVKNPTHFAVALKYDYGKNSAPIVVAKGKDQLALRIIKVAEENDVYVLENRPLARSLYDETELNCEIPDSYYGAIAEILVYVYRLKNKV